MSDNTSNIDKALNAAKARKAAKEGLNAPDQVSGSAPAGSTPAAEKAPKKSDEQKAAEKAAKDAERAAKKAERDALRATKRAEKDAAKKTPHMSKVDKAAEKLPTLSARAQDYFNDLSTNLSATDISGLAAHLNHFNRVKATGNALATKLSVGDTVRIVSGEARYLGQTGTVAKAQRIRCYVTVEGVAKDVYLYNSDVELVSAAPTQIAATGTEG